MKKMMCLVLSSIFLTGCSILPDPRKATPSEMAELNCEQLHNMWYKTWLIMKDDSSAVYQRRRHDIGHLGAASRIAGKDWQKTMTNAYEETNETTNDLAYAARSNYHDKMIAISSTYQDKACGSREDLTNRNHFKDFFTVW